jgi:hypothetical protein
MSEARFDFYKVIREGEGVYQAVLVVDDSEKTETSYYLRQGEGYDLWCVVFWGLLEDEATEETWADCLSDELPFDDAMNELVNFANSGELFDLPKYDYYHTGQKYDFDPEIYTRDDADSASPLVIGSGGQALLFTDETDAADDLYEQAKKELELAQGKLRIALNEKKAAAEVAKTCEANVHHRAVLFQIEDARVESFKAPDRALVPICSRGKMKTVFAADLKTYPFAEISVYQAYVNGVKSDLDDAIARDNAFLEAQKTFKKEDGEPEVSDELEDGAENEDLDDMPSDLFAGLDEEIESEPEPEPAKKPRKRRGKVDDEGEEGAA